MKYSISESELKQMGYTFQKLYAANYKTYRKKVAGYTVWLWSKGKTIEIDDWHHWTGNVLSFFKENINSPMFLEKSLLDKPSGYIKVQLNMDNGFVQLFDHAEYLNVLVSNSWDRWTEKYEGWSEIFLRKDSLKEVLREIKTLQA